MKRAVVQAGSCFPMAILASLAALGSFAPAGAYASCGEYVTMPSHGASKEYHAIPWLTMSSLSDSALSDSAHLDIDAELPILGGHRVVPGRTPCQQCPYDPVGPGNTPCQGPWCSGSHAPMTPPTAGPENAPEEWALRDSSDPLDNAGSVPHGGLRGHADRAHHVFAIYHPPRSA